MNRLLALLRLRRRQESRADAELAVAVRARRDAEVARAALARSDDAVSNVPRPTSLPELLALRLQGIALTETLLAAEEAVATHARDEAEARAARAAAATRRRSVERAVERRAVEEQLIGQRAARRGIAELARLRAVTR